MNHHTLKWFKNRTGKRVFRLTDNKCCKKCQEVFEHGLIIHDDFHAQYLFDCQNELGMKYNDTKSI